VSDAHTPKEAVYDEQIAPLMTQIDLDEDEVIHAALVKAARRARRTMNSLRQLADGTPAAVGRLVARAAARRGAVLHDR
jgi:hypothetical protein